MYFDFAGYRALRRVDDAKELARFLRQRGYCDSPANVDPVQMADWLRANATTDASQSLLIWMAFDPFGGLIALPLWLLSRIGWLTRSARR